jgi:hypothetical protein
LPFRKFGIRIKIQSIFTFFAFTYLSAQMFVFPYLNNVYRHLHYYPFTPNKIRETFLREQNIFDFKDPLHNERKLLTRQLVDAISGKEKTITLNKEFLYVLIEYKNIIRPDMLFKMPEWEKSENYTLLR